MQACHVDCEKSGIAENSYFPTLSNSTTKIFKAFFFLDKQRDLMKSYLDIVQLESPLIFINYYRNILTIHQNFLRLLTAMKFMAFSFGNYNISQGGNTKVNFFLYF